MDHRYIIFVALTRPAINKWGIPHKAFAFMFAGSLLFALWAGRGLGLVQIVFFLVPFCVSYLVLRFMTEWEPNWHRILYIWFITKAHGFGRPHGSTLAAMPVGIPRDPRDIGGAI